MRAFLIGAAALASTLAAGAADAATFAYSTDFTGGVGAEWAVSAGANSGATGILGELGGSSAASATLTQVSPDSGSGTLMFDLLLFRTMDGVNTYTDLFNLTINGSTRYQAAFGTIAGGGPDTVLLNPDGATFTRTDVDAYVSKRRISIDFVAIAGANTFRFSYPDLQSFEDEAWGLDNVTFTARVGEPSPGAIPEPSTWAMMILGFGLAGAMVRRRAVAA